VSGLDRRTFLATTAALATAWTLPRDALAARLATPAVPGAGPTSVDQTIRIGQRQQGAFRTLTTGPGEPYYPRLDLTGRIPDPARAQRRRSLAYLAHLTDIHLMDAQSPARRFRRAQSRRDPRVDDHGCADVGRVRDGRLG
jgi:hypothetical protein